MEQDKNVEIEHTFILAELIHLSISRDSIVRFIVVSFGNFPKYLGQKGIPCLLYLLGLLPVLLRKVSLLFACPVNLIDSSRVGYCMVIAPSHLFSVEFIQSRGCGAMNQ